MFHEQYYDVNTVDIDQTLVNSLHGLLICLISGLECRVIYLVSIEYSTYFVIHWSISFIPYFQVNIRILYT